MEKRLLSILLFVLCVSGAHHSEVMESSEAQRRHSKDAVPNTRSFQGNLITTKVFPTNASGLTELNGTQAPIPSHSPPSLELRSNHTIEYLRGPLSTKVIPIIYLLTVAVGIPANVAILCILASKIRKVSSAILYYSLAVSDLFLLLSLFFKAHYHLHGNHWVLGETACRVVTACFYGNLYCSAQTLACITVKRYLAVVHPFTYRTLPKRTYTTGVTLAVWAVFGAAMVPELITRQSYGIPQLGVTTCHDVLPLGEASHAYLLYYNLNLALLGLLLPLAVTAACYARIIYELRQSRHDWSVYIKASSLVFVIFALCFAPAGALHLLHYARLFADGTEGLYVHLNAAACLCCLHACLDPLLFLLMSKSARSGRYVMALKGKTLEISV